MVHLLARARGVRGWKPPELARRLRDLGARRGVPVGTRKDGVYRWEAGREPDKPTQRLIAELLGIPDDAVARYPWPRWLELDPLQQPTRYSWDAAGAGQALAEVPGRDDIMDRRKFAILTGATLTASLWAWLTAEPAAAGQITHARRLGETAVTHIETRVRQLRHTDDVDGGGQLLSETASSLQLVVRLLKDRSYTNSHGIRLYAAASDLARQRAAAFLDVQGECADAEFESALRAAHIAGDNALGAHCLAFWAVSAYNNGRLHDAEAMATTGLAAVRGRATPRVEAMLTSRLGRARAHLGDTRCWADFDRAEALLAHADAQQDEDPDWSYWFDQAELLGARASSHRDMHQPGLAEATFAQAHALFPPDLIRTHTLYSARQADAQWQQGDVEHACATAHQALDLADEISSHRAAGPLRDLAAAMSGSAQVPAVRDFRERVASTWPEPGSSAVGGP